MKRVSTPVHTVMMALVMMEGVVVNVHVAGSPAALVMTLRQIAACLFPA
jgi:hypothetical protein